MQSSNITSEVINSLNCNAASLHDHNRKHCVQAAMDVNITSRYTLPVIRSNKNKNTMAAIRAVQSVESDVLLTVRHKTQYASPTPHENRM
jgi:ERCC4-type nuclease